LGSISRVMPDIVSPEQMGERNRLISVMATYRKSEDLINIGAYVAGTNPQIDYAIKKNPPINAFLRQSVDEKVNHSDSFARLKSLFN